MIKLDNSKDSFYFCTTAGWSTIVKAEDVNKAASKAISKGIDVLKNEAEVSPCIRVKKVEEKFEDSDILIRIDKVFADIGMHKESKSILEIIENLK